MLIGYMRVSLDSDRQTTDLQRDALLAAGVDERHLFSDKASGMKDDRPGLARLSPVERLKARIFAEKFFKTITYNTFPRRFCIHKL